MYLGLGNTGELEGVQVGKVTGLARELDVVALDKEGVVVLNQRPDQFGAHDLSYNVLCWFLFIHDIGRGAYEKRETEACPPRVASHCLSWR